MNSQGEVMDQGRLAQGLPTMAAFWGERVQRSCLWLAGMSAAEQGARTWGRIVPEGTHRGRAALYWELADWVLPRVVLPACGEPGLGVKCIGGLSPWLCRG